jgi:hypothetical protein
VFWLGVLELKNLFQSFPAAGKIWYKIAKNTGNDNNNKRNQYECEKHGGGNEKMAV